jgi:hypothetical protein
LLLANLNANLESRVAFGQTAFDSPEVRATADIVAPDLLRGPHYQLGPTVSTFAFMNHYSVTSDYGPFTAPGDARLRRLIREIAAIAELQKIHQSDAFAKATVEAGKGVVQGAQHLIEDPVGTIGAVPEAVFSVFGRVSEATKRGGRSKYEDGVAQNLLAVSSFKRDYAKSSISMSTPPTRCSKELNSVAWASAAGNRSWCSLNGDRRGCTQAASGSCARSRQAKDLVKALPATDSQAQPEARQMRVPDRSLTGFSKTTCFLPGIRQRSSRG